MGKRKTRSVSARSDKPLSKTGSFKRPKSVMAEPSHSKSDSSIPEPSLKKEFLNAEGSSRTKAKPIFKEKMVDLELMKRIGIDRMFETLTCAPLLSPPLVLYPSLVREFYSNLTVAPNDMLFSKVKDLPIMLTPDWFGTILGVAATGPCPFTSHQPFSELDDLPYDEQIRTIVGDSSSAPVSKPLVSSLTPTCLLLFKLFHTNLLPRKSGRDRVTYQDSILLSLFVKQIPFNVASLLIRNMIHCASHESMHLPYPSLLTKVFEYFKVIEDSDVKEFLSDTFDSRSLSLNHLTVNESDELVFESSLSLSDTSLPESPTAPSAPQSFDNAQLNSLFQALSEKVDANSKSLDSLHSNMHSIESSLASLSTSMVIMHSKLDILKAHDKSIARTMDFEFGSLQEGMTLAAKAWEKEFVKLFFKLGSETQFLSKQITSISDKRPIPWHKKQDWIGDCTLEEITAPIPLPAIPPPAVFGLTKKEYMAKLFEWMHARDGKAPSKDFFEQNFSVYGETPKYKGKGKGKEPVDIPDDD